MGWPNRRTHCSGTGESSLSLNEFLRYWHTLRYLRPVQFYGRLWFRLYRPKVDGGPAPPRRMPAGCWQAPVDKPTSMLGPDCFRFLNHGHCLPEHGGWNDESLDKLWLYNLHYFDDLNAAGSRERRDWHLSLMRRWVAENPHAGGNGWEPYPTSLRIVNWVKWGLNGNVLPAECVDSLAVQTRWLAQRLERHLLGNHLFANAKALVFAGLFFEGDEADAWLATGLAIIAAQLPEQVLADGGHFERSTMYHAICVEDLLDLINAGKAWGMVSPAVLDVWQDAVRRMLPWLQGMSHPDGQIGFFNDAALGIAAEPAALRAYAGRVGMVLSPEIESGSGALRLHCWRDSGYIRLESPQAVALLDVAPVGPDYLPGHAHADTLSFELSVFGQRVIVNGGTSRYGLGPDRLRERSTACHSTVEVAGCSSSEVWGGFRVARRAHPFALSVDEQREALTVGCSHDGFARLPGKPIHRREWVLNDDGLSVRDVVTGSGNISAVARFILHPSVSVRATGDKTWELLPATGGVLAFEVLTGVSRLEAATFAPEFGRVIATQCVAVTLVAGLAEARITWK